MIFYAKAPLRISFAGGGTDVAPCPELLGGAVLNITINKYVYANILPRKDKLINIYSKDLERFLCIKPDSKYVPDGKFDLIKASLAKFENRKGLNLLLHSDVPPGSGLGSSSALVVAMLGVLMSWKKIKMNRRETAEKAWEIERKDLKIAGGRQDQYIAVFGGLNFMEFTGTRVKVNRLKVPREILNQLEYNLLLCFTGETHISSGIIEDQVSRYKNPDTIKTLKRLKKTAFNMKDMLMKGNLKDFGKSLSIEWEEKKKLSKKITNTHIDKLYDIGIKSGALGGKVLGAGGGGFILFYCDYNKKFEIANNLSKVGGHIKDFAFSYEGLQRWQAK